MNRKAVEWLYQELPELVRAGIIPPESAEKIKNHYGAVDGQAKRQTVFTVFSIIGAALIGLGIILILAHNWDQFTRLTRLLLSTGLLLVAQLLAGLAIWRKRDSKAWSEGTATFLALSVGASIALVGQTYHLADDTGKYLLTWMLLALPLIYIMDVTIPALLYIAGITVWTFEGQLPVVGKHFIWVLYGLLLPYYRLLLTREQNSNRFLIVTWALLISFYFSFGAAFNNQISGTGMLIYTGLFALTYVGGILCFDRTVNGWHNPFKALGLIGSVGVAFIMTFKSIWRNLGLRPDMIKAGESVLVFVILAAVIAGLVPLYRQKLWGYALFAGAPLIMGMGYLLQLYDRSGVSAAVLLNAYFMILSLYLIMKGVRSRRIAVLNIGMLMMAGLIGTRFMDIEFSFVVRGLVFVTLGICFLAANMMMARRRDHNEN